MFKQLVIGTTETLAALAVAPATVSKNVGKKISLRPISISLHAIAVLAMALAFQGLATAPAGADTLAACVTPGGDLKNVALGEDPSKPCGKNDTLVLWEEAQLASECPCDIRGMAGWAGWTGPICDGDNDPPMLFFARVRSDAILGRPIAAVSDDTNFGTGCETRNGVGAVVDNFSDLDAAEVTACFADLDELAFKLGLVGGCVPVAP